MVKHLGLNIFFQISRAMDERIDLHLMFELV